jgi:hypothetical protein
MTLLPASETAEAIADGLPVKVDPFIKQETDEWMEDIVLAAMHRDKAQRVIAFATTIVVIYALARYAPYFLVVALLGLGFQYYLQRRHVRYVELRSKHYLDSIMDWRKDNPDKTHTTNPAST